MRVIVRLIGRRLFLSQSRKFRLVRRVLTIVGIARVVTRVATPVRRIVLARDESMEIRITKNGQNAS
jgi:uncharacterized membrane protein